MNQVRQQVTERFTDRVGYYLRARPRYPDELIPFFVREMGLNPDWRVADIGSGTGFFSEPFLAYGNEVFGIEPNAPMRDAAERLLVDRYPRFHSRAGTAEATGLPDSSVDLVTAAQAFHWFDHPVARREFLRILKPNGWVALVWNNRRRDTALSVEYEQLVLRHAIDHAAIRQRHELAASDELLNEFFGAPDACKHGRLSNSQTMDFAALRDRLLSSSYMPLSDDPRFEPMIADLYKIFTRHQQGGLVRFEYDTDIYYGQLTAPYHGFPTCADRSHGLETRGTCSMSPSPNVATSSPSKPPACRSR
jgi:SAM-dependent methyltransferase